MNEVSWIKDPKRLPKAPGAYLLWIKLEDSALLAPRFEQTLPAGTYLYAGSAYGPGGIRSRCARHLGDDKIQRWHVDWLTSVATCLAVLPFLDGNECELVARLASEGINDIPLRGFGSSDCSVCLSHLISARGRSRRQIRAYWSKKNK
jgi:Uri superfamily endonuclease